MKLLDENGVNVTTTIPPDTLITNDDQNVTFPTEINNFVRHIGFYFANGTS